MFRQVSTVALVVLVALGSLAVATAAEPKEAGGKTKSPPKELTVDLGKGVKLEMVLIPAGEFLMGSPDSDKDADADEKPQHRVRITKPFYLGKYLVTQEQWEAVMGNNPSHFKGPKNPVETGQLGRLPAVSRASSTRRSAAERASSQLPSEAQWEYACRAGSTTQYCFGDDESKLGEYAWYGENSGDKTHPVGEKKPNAWGLYDMHGNVWEWCQDWYEDGITRSRRWTIRRGLLTGSDRVFRGGGWGDPAGYCRSAFRVPGRPGDRNSTTWASASALVPADKCNRRRAQARHDQADHQLDRHEAHARPFGRVHDGQRGVGGGDGCVLQQDLRRGC